MPKRRTYRCPSTEVSLYLYSISGMHQSPRLLDCLPVQDEIAYFYDCIPDVESKYLHEDPMQPSTSLGYGTSHMAKSNMYFSHQLFSGR